MYVIEVKLTNAQTVRDRPTLKAVKKISRRGRAPSRLLMKKLKSLLKKTRKVRLFV